MQFDAAIDQEEGNEDCADECDDSSDLFWNSDCTEEVKISFIGMFGSVHLVCNVCGKRYVNASHNCQYDTGHDDVNE